MTTSVLSSVWEFPYNFQHIVAEKKKTLTPGVIATPEAITLTLSIGQNLNQFASDLGRLARYSDTV
jgi:hypothetical protein